VALEEITGDMTNLAYRQEIMAENIDEVPGSLWKRSQLDADRVAATERTYKRIVVGVDPKASAEADSETGIVICGLGQDGHGYVLADYSLNGSPEAWAQKVAQAYEDYQADLVVVEKNQGGDMVTSVLRAANVHLPIKAITSSRGKQTRAEPVAALYERHMVHHVGVLPGLEDQQCGWQPGDKSPDRLDSLVFGISELMLATQHQRPRVREY
jgi:predicted phage terminase large subunit-like protein